MCIRLLWRFDSQRAARRLLSLLLCLTAVCGLTAPALAAEFSPVKASWEITYLGRSSHLPTAPQPPAPIDPADEPAPPSEEAAEIPASPEIDEGDWMLMLVNRDHALPDHFAPPALTNIGGGQQVDSRIADALMHMLADAQKAGHHPIVCSSFRTKAKQTQLHERKIQYYQSQGYSRTRASEKAAFWVARPDTSEHQAGLAVDIVAREYQVLDAKQEKTAVQQWLMAHCAEYGFVLRYPTDKSAVTHVGYEPWHYRYVGVAAATAMTEADLCLEEYLAAK